MDTIYRAVKYIRTSCQDDELEHRDSVANQSKLIDGFVKAYPEIMVVSEKIDSGFSGLFFDRPAFNEMIKDIEAGYINCVIVKDLSRIGRDYIEIGRYLRDFFPAHNVRLISVNDNIDSLMLEGIDKTIAILKSIFSERYSYDVSIKTRSALEAKRRKGEYVGAVPIYGYQKSADNKNKLIPDPNTVAVVQSIFDMKLQGMSATGIATSLNERGILSPLAYKQMCNVSYATGGFADKPDAKWSATTIFRILRDENYTGTLVQGRQSSFSYKIKTPIHLEESAWGKIENTHPAIISKSDYDAVQRIMALDTKIASGRKTVHPFSGMIICGSCGRNMTRKTVSKGKNKYIYYACSTGKKSGCYSPSMVREDSLINMVTQKVRERIIKIEQLELIDNRSYYSNFCGDILSLRILELDDKIRKLSQFKSSLYDSLVQGIITAGDFKDLQDIYENEISILEAKRLSLIPVPQDQAEDISGDCSWKDVFLQYLNMTKLDRRAVAKMIQSIRVISKEEILVDFVYQHEYEMATQYTALGV